MSKITQEVIEFHGFTSEEYDKVLDIMGREPNMTELGIFSVMWSEHCSYMSVVRKGYFLLDSSKRGRGPRFNSVQAHLIC